jgi:regulatory protein
VPAVVGEVGRGKRKDCHERALGLLAVRQRSRRELERRLSQAGFDEVQIQDSIRRLQAVGLVDDEAFARELAEHHVNSRRSGRRAVVGALAAKGVSRRVIEEAVADLGQGEEERALELARQRAPRLAGLPPEKAFGRLSSLLMRRGYDPTTARDAARQALRAPDGAQNPWSEGM